jgi:hypothetical protein
MYSLIESVKLDGLNPQLYIADLLARIGDHPARHIADLLPWNWKPADAARASSRCRYHSPVLRRATGHCNVPPPPRGAARGEHRRQSRRGDTLPVQVCYIAPAG